MPCPAARKRWHEVPCPSQVKYRRARYGLAEPGVVVVELLENRTGAGTALQVGAKWLADWCMHNAGDMDVTAVASTVATAVLEGRPGDELAAELFNMMGDGAFDGIQVCESFQPWCIAICTGPDQHYQLMMLVKIVDRKRTAQFVSAG